MSFNQEYTQIFDNYLNNQLSDIDKADFESKLKSNTALHQDFEAYKSFISLLKQGLKQDLKNDIQFAEKRYFRRKLYFKLGISLLSLVTILISTYYFFIYKHNNLPTESIIKTTNIVSIDTNDTSSTSAINSNTDENNSKLSNEIDITKVILDNSKKEEKSSFKSRIFTLKKVDKTSIHIEKDTIYIESASLIKKIIPYTRNNKSYILLDNSLYLKKGNQYEYIKDNRDAELIQFASGRGKTLTFKIIFYKSTFDEVESTIKSDDKYKIDHSFVPKEDFENFKPLNSVITRREMFFNLEDNYNSQ